MTSPDVQLPLRGHIQFASEPYSYAYEALASGDTLESPQLASCTIYVLSKSPEAEITLAGKGSLREGDVVQFENTTGSLKVLHGPASFLVAGSNEASKAAPSCVVTPAADVYKVTKPWGHELWLNGHHPSYALKRLEVKAGTRTSLQYHEYKHETTVFFRGTAALHYRAKKTSDDLKDPGVLAVQRLEPITSVTAAPPALHRVEAITDLVYFETSTAHLDDVIRLQDDVARPSGRIAEEHPK